MFTGLPNRAKIAIVILSLVALLFLWDWAEGDFSNTTNLIAGLVHAVLVIGLLFRLNAARVATIAISIVGVLLAVGYAVTFGIMGYGINKSDAVLQQALSGKPMSEEATTIVATITAAIQAVPWVVSVVGLLFAAVYVWLFVYMTSETALGVFGGKRQMGRSTSESLE